MSPEKIEVLVPANQTVEKRTIPDEPEKNPSAAGGAGPAEGDPVQVEDIEDGAKKYESDLDLDKGQIDGAIKAATIAPYWVPANEALDSSANPLAKATRDRPWRAESEGSGTSANAPDSADKRAATGKKK